MRLLSLLAVFVVPVTGELGWTERDDLSNFQVRRSGRGRCARAPSVRCGVFAERSAFTLRARVHACARARARAQIHAHTHTSLVTRDAKGLWGCSDRVKIAHPKTVADVQHIVQDFYRVQGVGSGHSWNTDFFCAGVDNSAIGWGCCCACKCLHPDRASHSQRARVCVRTQRRLVMKDTHSVGPIR